MALLFLVALVLAWPTYGLSVVAWFGLVIFNSSENEKRRSHRDGRKVLLEPLFGGQFAEFFAALDIPVLNGSDVNEADADKCGRHIMTYLAHNPEEGATFMKGLERWKAEGSHQLCHPVAAALAETVSNAKCEVHLVSYRAIESLMANNTQLRCFKAVDFDKLASYRRTTELKHAVASLK
jgi:hypothetical protein